MARPKKNKIEWNGFPNSDAAKKEIKASIDSTHESMVAIENEKAQLTDIFNELHEKYGMPRRVFNFLVKANYFGNQEITFEKNEELKNAWEEFDQI